MAMERMRRRIRNIIVRIEKRETTRGGYKTKR
jgi:hypothetical protein